MILSLDKIIVGLSTSSHVFLAFVPTGNLVKNKLFSSIVTQTILLM